jgi:Protein of unknown function (DUF3800)
VPKALKRLRGSNLPSLGVRDPSKPLFVAYIDESGDEGFSRNGAGAILGSAWFVQGAVVVRETDDLVVSRLVDDIKKFLNRAPEKALHFQKLSHQQKRWVSDQLASRPVHIVAHLMEKSLITSPDLQRFPKLYFRGVRHLLERITWLVDDLGGQVTLVFSNRSQLPYAYLSYWLRWYCVNDPQCQIRRPALSGVVRTEPHWSRKMLQLADAAASGGASAVEPHPIYGFPEPAYVQSLAPRLYRRGGRVIPYGLSFFPGTPPVGRFAWLDALRP